MYQRRCLSPLLLLFLVAFFEGGAADDDCWQKPSMLEPKQCTPHAGTCQSIKISAPRKHCLTPSNYHEEECPKKGDGVPYIVTIDKVDQKVCVLNDGEKQDFKIYTERFELGLPKEQPEQQPPLPSEATLCEIDLEALKKKGQTSACYHMLQGNELGTPGLKEDALFTFVTVCSPEKLKSKLGVVLKRSFLKPLGQQQQPESKSFCYVVLEGDEDVYIEDGLYKESKDSDKKNLQSGAKETLGWWIRKRAQKTSALGSTQTFEETVDCWNSIVDLVTLTPEKDKMPRHDYFRLMPLFIKAVEEIYRMSAGKTTRKSTAVKHFRAKMAHIVYNIFRCSEGWMNIKETKDLPISLKDVTYSPFHFGSTNIFPQKAFNEKVRKIDAKLLTGGCRFPFFMLNSMAAGLELKTAASKHRWDNFNRVARWMKAASSTVGQVFSVASVSSSAMGASLLNSLLDAISDAGKTSTDVDAFHRKIRLIFLTFYQSLMLEPGQKDSAVFKEIKVNSDCKPVYEFIQKFYLAMYDLEKEQQEAVDEAWKTCFIRPGITQGEAKAHAILTLLKSFISLPADPGASPATADFSAKIDSNAKVIEGWYEKKFPKKTQSKL